MDVVDESRNDEQGESSFVWSVIGAISQVCDLPVTTAVTCPTVRIHPAVIAQAAATAGVMTKGRFRLGVGSGEALNEHVTGARWPTADVRLDMLEEAVAVIRELFTGERVDHHGTHYTVEDARLYTRPEQPVPILVSGFGPKAIEVAASGGLTDVEIEAMREASKEFLAERRADEHAERVKQTTESMLAQIENQHTAARAQNPMRFLQRAHGMLGVMQGL